MKVRQIALVGSFLVLLAGCGNDSPINPPTTTGGTTTGGTTSGTTTGGTTGFPTTTGGTTGLPTTTGGFPTTTGGTTGTTTGGTTSGTTTGGTTGAIEGTVTLPSGASVAGAAGVFACYVNQAGACDETLSGFVEVQLAGVSSAAYSIPNLQGGQYAVVALADADGNGSVEDAADYVGVYSADGVSPTPVTPPQTGVDIALQLAGGGTPGEDDLTGSWTGTTTTPEPPQGLGAEETVFELTQNGSTVTGTLSTSGDVTDVTGTVSGNSAAISGTYTGSSGSLTYSYDGIFSGTTFSGAVTLSDGTNQVDGQFSVTRSGAFTAPFDKALLNRLFRSVR